MKIAVIIAAIATGCGSYNDVPSESDDIGSVSQPMYAESSELTSSFPVRIMGAPKISIVNSWFGLERCTSASCGDGPIMIMPKTATVNYWLGDEGFQESDPYGFIGKLQTACSRLTAAGSAKHCKVQDPGSPCSGTTCVLLHQATVNVNFTGLDLRNLHKVGCDTIGSVKSTTAFGHSYSAEPCYRFRATIDTTGIANQATGTARDRLLQMVADNLVLATNHIGGHLSGTTESRWNYTNVPVTLPSMATSGEICRSNASSGSQIDTLTVGTGSITHCAGN